MCVFCQQDGKCKSLITLFYIEYTFLIYFSFLQSSIQSGGNNISFNGSLYDQNHTEYKVNTAYTLKFSTFLEITVYHCIY
jgi:hypothetical protein